MRRNDWSSIDVLLGMIRTKISCEDGSLSHVQGYQVAKPIVRETNLDDHPHQRERGRGEAYIAALPRARLEPVAKAASLKQVAGGYGRDTRHGTLLADGRERGEVWLMCTVT
jgi:hypothetical protein